MEASEFTMSNEDFPALPGVPGPGPNSAQPQSAAPSGLEDLGAAIGHPQAPVPSAIAPIGTPLGTPAGDLMLQSSQAGSTGSTGTGNGPPLPVLSNNGGDVLQQQAQQLTQQLTQQAQAGQPAPGQQQTQQAPASGPAGPAGQQQAGGQVAGRRGIQTSPSGMVTNIPTSMVTDQFGMIGLLTFIRAAETDPNLVSLALGADLTTLGLNLNSEVNLYPTFGGPWAETPCRPQDIDYHVPYEYLTNTTIR